MNSAAGSFGLSFGLAFAGAIMLATLAFTFTASADASTVLSPEEQQQVSTVLEEDAEIMTNTGLEELLADEPPEVQDEVVAHQHRLAVHRAAGRAVRADPRGPPRRAQRVPDAAPPRSEAVGGGRGDDARLSESPYGAGVGAIHSANVGALTKVSAPSASTATGLTPEPASTGPVNAPVTGSSVAT